MGRNKRNGNARQSSAAYPATPATGRGTRTSSIFPYSVARPPTDFASPPIPATEQSALSISGSRGTPTIEVLPPPRQGANPFDAGDEENETILDPRETPLYARSDWGATTGTKTAWSRSSYPDFEDEIGTGGNEAMSEIGAEPTTTVWSRSSYASSDGLRTPPLPPLDDRARAGARHSEQGDEVSDPYINEPSTAWSQASGHTRQSQVGTTLDPLLKNPLPPSHTIPLADEPQNVGAIGKRSRQSVTNGNYSSALKSAGSRKPSQLVDIPEASPADSDPPSAARLQAKGESAQAENPFSPLFASAASGQPRPRPAGKTEGHHHRSTLPSILDLEQLAARPRQVDETAPGPAHGADAGAGRPHSAGPGTMYSLEPPPKLGRVATDSPKLLTPEAQNRLGRMSVATARYSLPPSRQAHSDHAGARSDPSRTSDPIFGNERTRDSVSRSLKPAGWWARLKETGGARWYRTWRPFLSASHGLIAALLMTIALADQSSGLGWVLKIQQGGLATMPAASGFGLSVSGWCQLDEDEVCSAYTRKDFANTDEKFTIPNNPTIDLLYPLWVALTTMTWFQALFSLSAAFLHFYLFFILSIPFSHLVNRTSTSHPDLHDSDAHGDSDSAEGMEEDQVQKEVDIRARCERQPFEEYIWVWWAWWAFRRGPVAHVYALIVGVLSLATTGLGMKLKRDADAAAMPGSVSLGMGGFLPLVVLLMTLDSFICSIRYIFFRRRRSLSVFTNPPEPTPAAVLLPPSEKPLALRHRGSRASSFFAAPTTARLSRGRTVHTRGRPPLTHGQDAVPPVPVSTGLDEETQRWLAEYPRDAELVPLIDSLRQGVGNDDFVLSDVGLLYLRPDETEPTGTALLVPPNGIIRHELLEDAHVKMEPNSPAGGHIGYDGMLDELERVFWWVGMEDDIEAYIDQCGQCLQTRPPHPQAAATVPQSQSRTDASKSTYTGITGWTGTNDGDGDRDRDMAVNMAVAMRKADEDAQRPWAG